MGARPIAFILSGYNELKNIRRRYELRARSFLSKPCRLEDIQNLIRAYSAYWELDGTPSKTRGEML